MLSASKTAAPSGGYNLTNSLRFRSSASAYLNRTPTVAGNLQKWTWSGWVKRGRLGTRNGLFGSVDTYIEFIASDVIEINLRAAATNYIWTTTQVFRDPSAWYHIVLAVDTTQATATDRMKLYVNGSQVTAFASSATIPQNTDTRVNSTALHTIGSYNATTDYLDGYQTEINFVNAQQLTPSSFGSTNATTGVWQPAQYTGTYGTNGFYLPFTDNSALTTTTNVGLGKDFSGNGNYWTTNNISVTAGTTYDAMLDSPTLTSATVGNYAVLNPIGNNIAYTVSNGNLTINNGSAPKGTKPASFFVTSGKWYWEVLGNGYAGAVCGTTGSSSTLTISSTGSNGIGYWEGGLVYWDGGNSGAGPASYTSSDVIGIALNMDAGTVAFYKNNSLQYTATFGSGTVPNLSSGCFPCYNDGASVTSKIANFNFGQRPFSYTPPTGFKALNTYNLPDSTIKKGNSYMDATLYTGAGGTSNITTLTFQPDLIWVKNRSNVVSHCWVDSNRGAPNQLGSDLTAAENSGGNDRTTYGGISTILSNGFTAVSGTDPTYKATNGSGQTYVAWYWKANQGTNTSNTSGSIASTVSVNTTAGFSVVTYTGTGANATVGHGLGVAPSFIIAKRRDGVSDWLVGTSALGWTKALNLNSTAAVSTTSTAWNNTSPTSSVFSISTFFLASTYVAYCWAEIAGFSKFGSYTGNGSTDGTFVYTGFRPAFIMWKRTDTTSNWYIEDSKRLEYNSSLSPYEIYPNLSNAEGSNGSPILLSNGFKLVSSGSGYNASGGTYIYAAFAENPFKNALAR